MPGISAVLQAQRQCEHSSGDAEGTLAAAMSAGTVQHVVLWLLGLTTNLAVPARRY